MAGGTPPPSQSQDHLYLEKQKIKIIYFVSRRELWGSTLKTNGLTIEHWPNFIPKPVGIQELPWFPEKWSFEKTARAHWSCDQGPDGGGCEAPLAAV